MQNKLKNAKPFLFDRSFDDPTTVKLSPKKRKAEEDVIAAVAEAARIAAETPPEPTFSEADLASEKSTAFEEGRQAGIAEANAEITSQSTSHLQHITAQLAVLHDKQQLANETHAATLAQVTSEITSKLLPYYALTHGTQEIVSFVRDCLVPILDDSRVIIRLPTESKDHLEEQLRQVADEAGFEGRLLVVANSEMGPADATVEWDGGGAERNWDDIWIEIDDAIKHVAHLADALQEEALDVENAPAKRSALEEIVANSEDMEAVLEPEDDQVPPSAEQDIGETTTLEENPEIEDDLRSGDQNGG